MDCTTRDETCTCQQPETEETELFTLFGRKNFVDRIIVNQLSALCFITSIILTLVICAVTYFRYVVQGNLYGYEEWVNLFAFWLYFMGAAAGAYNRTHVSADLVNAYMQDGIWKNILIILRNTITVGVCLLFTWYGYKFFVLGYAGPLPDATVTAKDWQRLFYFWLYFTFTCTAAFYAIYLAARLFNNHFHSSTGVEETFNTVETFFNAVGRLLPFPFPKLPADIRQKIHQFLVSQTIKLIVFFGTIIVLIQFVLLVGLGFKFIMLPLFGLPVTGIGSRMTPAWGIGYWYSYLAVLIGLVLMSCYFTRDWLRSIVRTILEYTAKENNGQIYLFFQKFFRFNDITGGREQ